MKMEGLVTGALACRALSGGPLPSSPPRDTVGRLGLPTATMARQGVASHAKFEKKFDKKLDKMLASEPAHEWPQPTGLPANARAPHSAHRAVTLAACGAILQPVQRGTAALLKQSGVDLYRLGATLNSLSFKATVLLLGTPIEALRARQRRSAEGNPSTLDYLKVMVELGAGPLAVAANTGLMLTLLAKHPVLACKVLVPLELVKLAYGRWVTQGNQAVK